LSLIAKDPAFHGPSVFIGSVALSLAQLLSVPFGDRTALRNSAIVTALTP